MRNKAPSPAAVVALRDAAMSGVPYKLPTVRVREDNDKLLVTVEFVRPRWQQVMGADQNCQRTFGLDAYGQSVYQSCDGQRSVRQIVDEFARNNKVSRPEAELAVTRFMRTLISKGLIAMQMEKPTA